MYIKYPNLAGEIAKRGIKKMDIAASIGICNKALLNKMCGRTSFSWPEVKAIRQQFFPDMTLAYLFAEDGDENAS